MVEAALRNAFLVEEACVAALRRLLCFACQLYFPDWVSPQPQGSSDLRNLGQVSKSPEIQREALG